MRVLPAVLGAALLVAAVPSSAAASATDCAPLSARSCAMPFPNDQNHTVADADAETGRRVRLAARSMPRNKAGRYLNVTEHNRSDGFSPGQEIVVAVPGLTSDRAARRSRLPRLDDLDTYAARDAGVVVLDARTGRRHPVWAEIDANVRRARDRTLLIHPAKNFTPGRRYVVVLRGLRTASGKRIAPVRNAGARRSLKAVTPVLKRARIGRSDVHLAWRFTVASDRSTMGRVLHMRDQAFLQLGDRDLADGKIEGAAPAFQITEVTEPTTDPRIARRIKGSFTVPCFLRGTGCPVGSPFNMDAEPDALPQQKAGNVMRASLDCSIPTRALAEPARIAQYGHGLLGRSSQIDEDNIKSMSAEHNFVFCATDWSGMAAEDVPYAVQVLQDLGKFRPFADRIQQGYLNQMVLSRLLAHPQGLASHPAFQVAGRPVFDGREVFWDSNSQGGIMGVAFMALSPDIRRGVLGVPAINYSVLLPRSVDFDVYAKILNPAYPNADERQLALAVTQLLWDRGDGNGYAHRLTSDPPPNTPAHTVLLHPANGDHQVTNWQADVLARTADIPVRRPSLAPSRTHEREPQWGLDRIPRFPWTGSAMVYWDPGADFTGVNPVGNVPQRAGKDSHFAARSSPLARRQKAEFLRPGGAVIDVCGPGPCEGVDDDTP
jgi:hypothetical protein